MTIEIIKAPSPGVFYRRPSPEEPCYKEVGDTLDIGETIGLIEVMKTFIHVQSKIKGRVKKFLVENEQAIVPGQALLEVELLD